jgi:hypothetical protein
MYNSYDEHTFIIITVWLIHTAGEWRDKSNH